MIGRRCKRCETFSRAVLIARELYVTVRYVEGSTGASVRETVASVLLLDHVEDIKDTHGDYSAEVHLFPFRTEKLSPAAPMILH